MSRSTQPHFDRLRFMEVWLTGYNACRDGVPNDFDAIMERVKADWPQSSMGRSAALAQGQKDPS